ncbi:MAG: hemerythrin domain-containing protein [Actinomycetota bacterium]
MTGKTNLSADTRMSDAVSENPFLLLFLEHLEIELPMQERSVGDLANEHNIPPGLFQTLISLYSDVSHSVDIPLTGMEMPVIIRFLQNSHRYYTEDVYPGIMDIIRDINNSGSSRETVMIEKFFMEYLAEVKNHFDYEEETVFPYIRQLMEMTDGVPPTQEMHGYSVAEYKEHHDDIEEKLDDLKSLLIEYLPLKEGKKIRRKLLFRLYELEHDLRIHSRIEDYILIPLVASMEEGLKK